jgi:uncharacterized membrane protein (UPF0127 family)
VPTPDARARLVVLAAVVLAAVVGVVGLSIALFGDRGDDTAAEPLAGFVVTALAGATPAEEPFAGLTELSLLVGDDCLRLVVADGVDERVQGLRGRSDLGPYDGMLFVFEEPAASSFTMRGVPVPLDVAWYDASGGPVDRTEMEPCAADDPSCPPYSSRSPYRFAIETLGGDLPAGAMAGCPS